MTKSRRLGRGLEALLGQPIDGSASPTTENSASPTTENSTGNKTIGEAPGAAHELSNSNLALSASEAKEKEGLVQLNVFEIDANEYQPRANFDDAEMQSLVDSIAAHGMLQPIVVRKKGARFELISGERRMRAAVKAGWVTIPAQIRDADDREVAELAIVENVQRKDLSVLEKAASFHRYLEQYHCKQEELSRRIHIDRSTIANLVRLLELPDAVQQSLRAGDIGQGHARALLPLGEERDQIDFCKRIKSDQLSVRDVEQLVHETIHREDHEALAFAEKPATNDRPKKRESRSLHLKSLEQEMRAAVGAKIDIRQAARGRGRIVIHFSSNDEFERLRQMLLEGTTQTRSEAG